MMFLLWKNLLYIPVALLVFIGTPFKYTVESNLRHLSEKGIKEAYNRKRTEHYFGKVWAAVGLVVGVLVFCFLTWITEGYFLIIFPIITIIVLGVDALLIFARWVYTQEKAKEAAATGTELVLMEVWKDTSLKSLLQARNEELEKFKEEYFNRTGRYPTSSDIRFS